MKYNKEFHTVRGYQLLEDKENCLTSAMEDYLEMIYRHVRKEGYMRVNTLAELLNVKASSATKMVQSLGRLELVNYEKYGIISLTEKGENVGESLLNRHNIIESFLKKLGDSKNSLIETELIEHYIGESTLKKFELLNKFLESNPDIVDKFKKFKKERAE